MEMSETVIFGMDLPMLVALPLMLAIFVFAVWYGVTSATEGIDADEQARRMAADGGS